MNKGWDLCICGRADLVPLEDPVALGIAFVLVAHSPVVIYPLLSGFPGDCDLGGVGDFWGHELHVRCDTFHSPSVFSLRIMVASGAWGSPGEKPGPFSGRPTASFQEGKPLIDLELEVVKEALAQLPTLLFAWVSLEI